MPDEKSEQISGILEEMTIDQVRQLAPEVVVLPIGSTEPHGPHLPYGTDSYQVDAVCRQAVTLANAGGGRVLMYPNLPIGNNVNFKAFPFACRIGVRTLMSVVQDIVQALEEDGIRKIVLVNGHGGNSDTLQTAIREHCDRRRPGAGAFLCMTDPCRIVPAHVLAMIEHPSDHAGEAETSRMLHLRPDLVHCDKLSEFPRNQPVMPQLRSGKVFYVRPWHAYVPTSAGGDVRCSTAEKGRLLTQEGAKWLAQFLVDLTSAAMHDLFPYAPAPAPTLRNPAIPLRFATIDSNGVVAAKR